jgi:hypothetical protein
MQQINERSISKMPRSNIQLKHKTAEIPMFDKDL